MFSKTLRFFTHKYFKFLAKIEKIFPVDSTRLEPEPEKKFSPDPTRNLQPEPSLGGVGVEGGGGSEGSQNIMKIIKNSLQMLQFL